MRLLPLLRRALPIMTSPAQPAAAVPPALPPSSPTGNVGQLKISRTAPIVPAVPIPRNGVDYRNKVVLAPMVRSGELPCRLLALHYGADLVWGPETVDKSMIGCMVKTNPRTGCLEWSRSPSRNNAKIGLEIPMKESIIYRIDPKRESRKLVYQIGTSTPSLAVEAASMVAPYVAGIDVNAGCPKPFSTSGGMGAALLLKPDLLSSILTALVSEVGKPHEIGISVKIRLLETPEKTSALVNQLCKTGITGLTIHCRTTPMRPRQRAIREQLSMISTICHNHGVACLMNGDVTSREEGIELAQQFDCDGAMIATAAESNPAVFLPSDARSAQPWPTRVHLYLQYALSVENKWGNSKFTLSQLIPGKSPLFQPIQRSRSYSEVISIMSSAPITVGNTIHSPLPFQDPALVSMATEVDEVLGLKVQQTSNGVSDAKRERDNQPMYEGRERAKRSKDEMVEKPDANRVIPSSLMPVEIGREEIALAAG